MAGQGFKIADGYVEITTKFDGNKVADAVGKELHQVDPVVQDAGRRHGRDWTGGLERESRRRAPGIGRGLGKGMFAGLGDVMQGSAFLRFLTNPAGVAVVAAAGVLLGQAFAGAFGIAAGVGVIGLGAWLLRNDPAVRSAGARLGKALSDTFIAAAQPMKGALIANMEILAQRIVGLRPLLTQTFANSAPLIAPLSDALFVLVRQALPGFNSMLKGLKPLFDALIPSFNMLGQSLGALFRQIGASGPGLAVFFKIFFGLLSLAIVYLAGWIRTWSEVFRAFAAAQAWLSRLGQSIRSWASSAGSTIRSWASSVIAWFASMGSAVGAKVGAMVSAVLGWFGRMRSEAAAKVSDLRSSIISTFSGAGSWLVSAGSRIIGGLIDGIRSKIGELRSLLNSVTNLIPDWKGPEDTDKRLLIPAGRNIMGGLMEGIGSQLPALQVQLSGVTGAIPAALPRQRQEGRVGSGSTWSPTIVLNVTAAPGADGQRFGREALVEIDRGLKRLERERAR